MPWARFDERFPWHRKVRRISDSAFRLHVSAICWCSEHLTNGEVKSEEIGLVSDVKRPRTQVETLVKAGLWDVTAGGWYIHDYLIYNPSRARVEADREQAKERQQRAREKASSRRDSRVTDTVGSDEVTDLRPDPTRPDPKVQIQEPRAVTPIRTATMIGSALLDEHYRNVPTPNRVKQRMGEVIDDLIEEGFEPDVVRDALERLRQKPNGGPGLLPSLVGDVMAERSPRRRTESERMFG